VFRRHFATPLEPGRCYPFCVSGRRAVPPEDCGGPWAFLELRQHYSVFHVAERLLELLKPVTSDDGHGEDEDEFVADPDDHCEELVPPAALAEDRSFRPTGC
jgi:hypothetical protein